MPAVTMPDGQVVQMPDQLDAATAQRLRAFQAAAQQPQNIQQVQQNADQAQSDVIGKLKALGRGFVNTMAQGTDGSLPASIANPNLTDQQVRDQIAQHQQQDTSALDQGMGLGKPDGSAGEIAGGFLAPTVAGLEGAAGKVGQLADATRDEAVNILRQAGVPLDRAQITGSKLWQTVRNAIADNPFIGGGEFEQGQKAAFTRATLKMIGQDSGKATPSVMASAQKEIGGMFQDVFARNKINMEGNGPTLLNDLAGIEEDASSQLKPDQLSVIKSQISNLINHAAKGNGQIDGLAVQNAKTSLDRLSMGSDSSIGYYARQIRESLLDAMQRSVSPEDMQKFQQARTMWRRLEQIAPAIGSDEQIAPSALYRSIDTLKNQQQSVYGKGDQSLVKLAQSGSQILRDSANSGTTRRMLGTASLAAAGGAVDEAAHGNYKTAASMGLLTFLGPAGMRAVLQHPEWGPQIAQAIRANLGKTAPRLAAGLAINGAVSSTATPTQANTQ